MFGAGFEKKFARRDQSGIEPGATPAGRKRGQTRHGRRGPRLGRQLFPFFKVEDRAHAIIKRQQRDLIARLRFLQKRLCLAARFVPEVFAPHARAQIKKNGGALALVGIIGGILRLGSPEWAAKADREQRQNEAAQQEKPEILESAPARHARRARRQKHQRTEGRRLAGRSADQVKNDRPDNRQPAKDKKRREKTHAAFLRRMMALPRCCRIRKKSKSTSSSGWSLTNRWRVMPRRSAMARTAALWASKRRW